MSQYLFPNSVYNTSVLDSYSDPNLFFSSDCDDSTSYMFNSDPIEQSEYNQNSPNTSQINNDNDDCSLNSAKSRKDRRARSKFSAEQLAALENSFHVNPSPKTITKVKLAKQLNLTQKIVQIWFQNRRAKQKLHQKRNTHLEKQDFEHQLVTNHYKYELGLKYPTHNSFNEHLMTYPGLPHIDAIPSAGMYSSFTNDSIHSSGSPDYLNYYHDTQLNSYSQPASNHLPYNSLI